MSTTGNRSVVPLPSVFENGTPFTMQTLNVNVDTNDEISSIQAQIAKWLSSYEKLVTEQQFIELLQKLAPWVKQSEVQELFRSIDYQGNGAINKQLLVQNNYLANLVHV